LADPRDILPGVTTPSPDHASASRVLGLFAKWPRPGAVKTRLAAALGPDVSARIARAFLLDTVVRLGQVPTRRVLAFAPPESREAFTELIQGRFELTPQQDGDLG